MLRFVTHALKWSAIEDDILHVRRSIAQNSEEKAAKRRSKIKAPAAHCSFRFLLN
jgi:hypothetical protein